MTVREIVNALALKELTARERLDVEVSGGYTSDLLSDVMANSQEKNIWITLQVHPNIVAVAKLKELAAIIIVNNRTPEEETLKKAEEEGIPILQTSDSAFVVSGKLYAQLSLKD